MAQCPHLDQSGFPTGLEPIGIRRMKYEIRCARAAGSRGPEGRHR